MMHNAPTGSPSGARRPPQIRIEVVTGPPGRLRRIHTNGLWWAGLPELFADPPAHFTAGTETDWALLTFLLAGGLVSLGQELLEAEDFDLEPHHDIFRGRPVQLWLDRHEAPDDDLERALGSVVDTVIRVECSLWAPPR
ncbi:hypothetical protein KIH74_25180 [Kineosporia sp. J2-2]|uniref:Uncharacterized protein n=1 Tax=Kineosporia corallincola TaxID=2835133 RepID=A0ABS5TMD4_9ACTN|nr:hypothetical protein [Kineosporia corallincola]MBT0772263.1 hypothetical protein [Kineosporia corallincola]